MPTFYGELAWREQNEEMISLRSLRGSSFPDRLKNNGLPIGWDVKDAQGTAFRIDAGWIGKITTIRLCAKSLQIDFDALVNLTDDQATRLFSSYPQWLYEKSSKSALFHLLDDKVLDEATHVAELAIRYHVMSRKFDIKFRTGRETFAYKDAYILMGKILIENAVMRATAQASNHVVDTKLGAIYERYLDNEAISDAECRTLLRSELKKIQAEMHEELPSIYHKELDLWSRKVILQIMPEEESREERE